MSFIEEVAGNVRARGGTCSVRELLERLPSDDADDLRTAIDRSAYPATAIALAARKRGWALNDAAIARHRRRACQCRTS